MREICLVNISPIPGEQYLMTSLELEFLIVMEKFKIAPNGVNTIFLSKKPTWAYEIT
jgi:hypothetical protein